MNGCKCATRRRSFYLHSSPESVKVALSLDVSREALKAFKNAEKLDNVRSNRRKRDRASVCWCSEGGGAENVF